MRSRRTARLSSRPACASFTCVTRGIYVRWANTGAIEKIAGLGDVAPIPPLGSVTYRDYVYGPYIGNGGQLIFTGGVNDPYPLPPVPTNPATHALFHVDDGQVTALVYPGQSVTTIDGQSFTFWRVSFIAYNQGIENNGRVAFAVQLLTDGNGDEVRDSAVFVWEDGDYTLVAKSGDTLPGIGVVREILAPASIAANSQSRPSGGIQLNSRGQVAFHVTLEPAAGNPGPLGVGALIVATP